MHSTNKRQQKRKEQHPHTLRNIALAFLPLILFSLTVIFEQTAGDIFMGVLFVGIIVSTYMILSRQTPLWSVGWFGMTATLLFFLTIYDYRVFGDLFQPLLGLGLILSCYVAYRLFRKSPSHLAIAILTSVVTLAARWMVFTSFDFGGFIFSIPVAILLGSGLYMLIQLPSFLPTSSQQMKNS